MSDLASRDSAAARSPPRGSLVSLSIFIEQGYRQRRSCQAERRVLCPDRPPLEPDSLRRAGRCQPTLVRALRVEARQPASVATMSPSFAGVSKSKLPGGRNRRKSSCSAKRSGLPAMSSGSPLELGGKEQRRAKSDKPEQDERSHSPGVRPVSRRHDGHDDRPRDRSAKRRAEVGDAA